MANEYEMKAQLALLWHAVTHRAAPNVIHDQTLYEDHWDRTTFVFLEAFENEKAVIEVQDGTQYHRTDLIREEWSEEWLGGFLYKNRLPT